MAADAATRYFAALTETIPFDTAPGEVNLIAEVVAIQAAIEADRMRENARCHNDPQDTALRAGYVLGVEIGRRMRGAR
jgi:hypothetical protein